MIPELALLRELTLSRAPQAGRALHLSAASGLVCCGEWLYVIADDENHLGVFPLADHAAPGDLLRLRAGDLPDKKCKRKKQKADFEAMVALPSFGGYPHGALLVMGSGSRANRMIASLIALDAHGVAMLKGDLPRAIDFTPLFTSLTNVFAELNIEGAFVDGEHLALLQRGNTAGGRNARIRVALAPLLAGIARGDAAMSGAHKNICDFSLGDINGVPLGFTDGAALPGGGFVFTAAAEDTDDAYDDGACEGSVIGMVGADDQLRHMWRLDGGRKLEGIAVRGTAQGLQLLLVTDLDDANVPGQLLTTIIAPWQS